MIITDPKRYQEYEYTRQLVNDCEEAFEKQLAQLCTKVGLESYKVILLSGPTCSGKTTTTNKLVETLNNKGNDVYIVSVDDFYYDRMYLMARSEQLGADVDFESIAAIDLPFFKMCMQSLLSGEKTLLPHYDFKLGRRSAYYAYQLKENSVIIVEGIQSVYPEITKVFEGTDNLSVFISTERGVCCGESCFTPVELRLIRRLVRDSRNRGATAEFTFSIWKSVTDNEERSIMPYKDKAVVKIDSSMGYEPYLMRQFLIPLLEKDVSKDSPYYLMAKSLVERLEKLPTLDALLIPKESVYHEFIG